MALAPKEETSKDPVRSIKIATDGSIKIADAAFLFGKTSQTIRNWIEAGAPVATGGDKGRGNVTRVVVQDVIAWRDASRIDEEETEHGYDEKTSKAALAHFKAIKAESEARRELGSLIPVDVIVGVIAEQFSDVRATMMSIPGRLATRLAAETDSAVTANVIMKEINRALASLSSPEDAATEAGADLNRSIEDPVELPDIDIDVDFEANPDDQEETADTP